jgi:hypothetical protein
MTFCPNRHKVQRLQYSFAKFEIRCIFFKSRKRNNIKNLFYDFSKINSGFKKLQKLEPTFANFWIRHIFLKKMWKIIIFKKSDLKEGWMGRLFALEKRRAVSFSGNTAHNFNGLVFLHFLLYHLGLPTSVRVRPVTHPRSTSLLARVLKWAGNSTSSRCFWWSSSVLSSPSWFLN